MDETYDEKKMALFRIQGTSPSNMQAFQVDRVSLSSGNNLQGGGFLSFWSSKNEDCMSRSFYFFIWFVMLP